MIFCGGRGDTAAFVDDDRASPAGTNVNAEYVDRASLDSRSPLRENTGERDYPMSPAMMKRGFFSKLA